MDAEKLFIDSVNRKSRKLIEHTGRVVKMCNKFADSFPLVNRQLLIDAAWLHDIAKYSAGADHHKPKEVKKAITKYAPDTDDLESIIEIISAHKGSFEPHDYVLESAILRICDKLDKFDKGQDSAEKKCKKSMKMIKGKMDSHDFKILKKLYRKERNSRLHKKFALYLIKLNPLAPG